MNQIFIFFENNDVIFVFVKCYFVYSNIKTSNHHVFKFDLNTTKNKIKTIWKMIFFKKFRNLKINFEFFEFYRFFVDHFAIIVKFFIKFKIQKFVNESIKNKSKRKLAIRMRLQQKMKKFRNFNKKLNVNDECRRIWKKFKKKIVLRLF